MLPKLFIATKAVIVHKEKILILRESGSYVEGTNTGRYDLPGGRLQPGERFDEALKREVLEETGLEVQIGRPLTVQEWRPIVHDEPWQVVGVFFMCHVQTAEVRLGTDHDAHEWVAADEWRKYNIIPNLVPVFETYMQVSTKKHWK